MCVPDLGRGHSGAEPVRRQVMPRPGLPGKRQRPGLARRGAQGGPAPARGQGPPSDTRAGPRAPGSCSLPINQLPRFRSSRPQSKAGAQAGPSHLPPSLPLPGASHHRPPAQGGGRGSSQRRGLSGCRWAWVSRPQAGRSRVSLRGLVGVERQATPGPFGPLREGGSGSPGFRLALLQSPQPLGPHSPTPSPRHSAAPWSPLPLPKRSPVHKHATSRKPSAGHQS